MSEIPIQATSSESQGTVASRVSTELIGNSYLTSAASSALRSTSVFIRLDNVLVFSGEHPPERSEEG